MQPETKLLSELQPLMGEQMGIALAFPCHEDGGELEPFVWQGEQGELSAWNLLQSQGWVRPVDLSVVLQLWQAPEIGAVNGDPSLIPENDPAGILLDDQRRTERAEVYGELGQLLKSRLQNLQAYELSCDSDYRLGLLLGQAEEGWLGWGSTVPIATPASPSPLQTVVPPQAHPSIDPSASPEPTAQETARGTDSPTEAEIKDESVPETTSETAPQIQAVLAKLAPLTIYGYYGGGYNQTHSHRLVQVAAAGPSQVLEMLLHQVGLFRLDRFEALVPTASGAEQAPDQQCEALTAFLHRRFSELWDYRFSFWTWEQVFILGQDGLGQAGDWGGVVLRSHFTYNP